MTAALDTSVDIEIVALTTAAAIAVRADSIKGAGMFVQWWYPQLVQSIMRASWFGQGSGRLSSIDFAVIT